MSDSPADVDWLKLDNAAKIYPATHSDATPAVFRISITLKEPIRIREMQEALDLVVQRVPYYQVHLRRGFFWYYLQRHSRRLRIRPLPEYPVTRISLKRHNEQLLHVYARESTVAADFSHVLTDGYGGMRFLGSVVVEYLRLLGENVERGAHLLDPGAPVPPEEYEDSFQKLYRPGVPKAPDLEPAYHVGGIPYVRGYRTVTGRMPVAEALSVAKGYRVTLTEYVVAAYMESIKAIHDQQAEGVIKPRHSIVRIEVPVNMRRHYESTTMRNFSLFVSPEIDLRLGEWEFETIVRRVHNEMNIQVDKNELVRQVARNVGGERVMFVRLIPRAIKDAYLGHLKRTIGDRSYSGVVSNLGRFLLPDEAKPFVASVGFALGPNIAYKTGCSVVSFDHDLYVTFGSVIHNRAVERSVFRRFAADGINVIVSEQTP